MKPLKVLAVVTLMTMGGLLSSPLLVKAQDLSFVHVRSGKPKEKADKIATLYKVSRFYLAGATAFDMWSTAKVIGHPTVARRPDGDLLAYYHGQEVGWAGFLGRRDTRAAIAANVVLNVGLTLLSRKLYQKGGRWRVLAIVVNVAKGTDNVVAGVGNVRYGRTVDGRVSAATGYGGPIVWSH